MRYTIREIKPTASFSAGAVVSFDFQSILNEFRSWSFPCIHDMAFRWVPTMTTGSSGGVPRLLPQYFAGNILVQDVGGQRVNLAGASLHTLLKYEYGQRYANIAAHAVSDSTPFTQELYFPIPVKPPKSRRDRDYSIPVDSFLDGGSVQLTCGPATAVANYYTVASAELSLVVRIVEEGQPELKSRFLCRDQIMPSADYAGYIIGGFARSILAYSGATNEVNQTPWTAGALWDSYTLNYQQVRSTAFRQFHLMESETFRPDSGTPATASAIQNEDPVWTGQVVPLSVLDEHQKITDMVQMSTLHVRTSVSVPSDAKLITTVIEERNPLASQRSFKRTDVGNAIASQGRVKTANGQKKRVQEFPTDLVNVLPVKIDAGK